MLTVFYRVVMDTIYFVSFQTLSVLGMIHKQAEEVCDTGKCGISFLEDLAGVAESPYGRGVIEKLLRQDDGMRENVCLSSLFICRYSSYFIFKLYSFCCIISISKKMYSLKQIKNSAKEGINFK